MSADLRARLDDRRQTAHTGMLVARPEEAYVGDTITIEGRNLPTNEAVDVFWETAVGGWGVMEGNEVTGPQFKPRIKQIASVSTDATGAFTIDWEIPEDYGGEHRMTVRTGDGTSITTTSVTITPWFEIVDTSVPLSETFQIHGYGLGPNMITNNYQIAWDNGMVGFITGTMNSGTATADIRAVGPVGTHVIQVWRNLRGVPFLQNNTQSPFGPVGGERQASWSVEVTPPETEPAAIRMDSLVQEDPLESHYPEVDDDTEAELEITPTSGQPGTTAFIRGEQFPPETTVDLIWYTHVGNRIAGQPITPEPLPEVLPTVTTDESGEFHVEVTIPQGMGGTRPIVAEVEGSSVAVTGFVMQPQVVTFEPTEGPVGTDIEIELTGIGWPTYENAYFFVYDNRPLGYVCGVDMEKGEGIVRTEIQATGEPGYHFIDVYPSFFETKEELPDVEQKAHLSYRNNHPVRPLPAINLAFEITDE